MEAHAEHAHHHHDHDDVDLNPAAWSDGKRYAWLLGIVVPLAPFIAWGAVSLTGWGGFYFFGPLLVFVAFPILDIVIGMDSSNPPDSVLKWLEQDRYYRWCTYLFIPVQYGGLVLACYLWSNGGLSTIESIGLALTMGVEREVWLVLDTLRRKRNINDYSGDLLEPEAVAECLRQADSIHAHTRAWLGSNFPELLSP